MYRKSSDSEPFTAYTDADHGGDPDNGKSTGGYLITVAGGAVSWSSKLQSIVALSSTEAEYIAAVDAGKEILWMRNMLFTGNLAHLESTTTSPCRRTHGIVRTQVPIPIICFVFCYLVHMLTILLTVLFTWSCHA